jgi:hypothetical protein
MSQANSASRSAPITLKVARLRTRFFDFFRELVNLARTASGSRYLPRPFVAVDAHRADAMVVAGGCLLRTSARLVGSTAREVLRRDARALLTTALARLIFSFS